MTDMRGLHRLWNASLTLAAALAAVSGAAATASTTDAPTASATSAPPAALPPSDLLSPESQAALSERTALQNKLFANPDLTSLDRITEEIAKSTLDEWLRIYPSSIERQTIDGVTVYVVTPKAGVAARNKRRVLIGAHQGGFLFGSRYSALVEAVPIAGRGGVTVIAVDYRKAPQFVFPAASEDMEAVYRHVLKTTPAANVGIFGCSAGGTLVGESVARFQAKGLPRPGAVSIMCSGLMKSFWYGGDSQALQPVFTGRPAPRSEPGPYFKGANADDPLVAPGHHPQVLAHFPPTLLVSGTRDIALSNVLITHAAMLEAGVDARLFIQEGMGHGHFFYFPGTPESRVAYDVIWQFFDRTLAR